MSLGERNQVLVTRGKAQGWHPPVLLPAILPSLPRDQRQVLFELWLLVPGRKLIRFANIHGKVMGVTVKSGQGARNKQDRDSG